MKRLKKKLFYNMKVTPAENNVKKVPTPEKCDVTNFSMTSLLPLSYPSPPTPILYPFLPFYFIIFPQALFHFRFLSLD